MVNDAVSASSLQQGDVVLFLLNQHKGYVLGCIYGVNGRFIDVMSVDRQRYTVYAKDCVKIG